jgi:hypothetical protein
LIQIASVIAVVFYGILWFAVEHGVDYGIMGRWLSSH